MCELRAPDSNTPGAGARSRRGAIALPGDAMTAGERPYITCRELIDFLYLYLEDELPEDRRSEFERHLGVCPPCREYIRQYRESIQLGKAAFAEPDGPADDVAPEELVKAILDSRRKT